MFLPLLTEGTVYGSQKNNGPDQKDRAIIFLDLMLFRICQTPDTRLQTLVSPPGSLMENHIVAEAFLSMGRQFQLVLHRVSVYFLIAARIA